MPAQSLPRSAARRHAACSTRALPTQALPLFPACRGAGFIDYLLSAGRGNYTELLERYGEAAPIADDGLPYAVLGGGPPGEGDKYASVVAGYMTSFGFPTALVDRAGLDPYAFLDSGSSSAPVGAIVGGVLGGVGES